MSKARTILITQAGLLNEINHCLKSRDSHEVNWTKFLISLGGADAEKNQRRLARMRGVKVRVKNEIGLQELCNITLDFNQLLETGDTLLHVAFKDNLPAVMLRLIQYGASPLIANEDGKTVLELALDKLFDIDSKHEQAALLRALMQNKPWKSQEENEESIKVVSEIKSSFEKWVEEVWNSWRWWLSLSKTKEKCIAAIKEELKEKLAKLNRISKGKEKEYEADEEELPAEVKYPLLKLHLTQSNLHRDKLAISEEFVNALLHDMYQNIIVALMEQSGRFALKPQTLNEHAMAILWGLIASVPLLSKASHGCHIVHETVGRVLEDKTKLAYAAYGLESTEKLAEAFHHAFHILEEKIPQFENTVHDLEHKLLHLVEAIKADNSPRNLTKHFIGSEASRVRLEKLVRYFFCVYSDIIFELNMEDRAIFRKALCDIIVNVLRHSDCDVSVEYFNEKILSWMINSYKSVTKSYPTICLRGESHPAQDFIFNAGIVCFDEEGQLALFDLEHERLQVKTKGCIYGYRLATTDEARHANDYFQGKKVNAKFFIRSLEPSFPCRAFVRQWLPQTMRQQVMMENQLIELQKRDEEKALEIAVLTKEVQELKGLLQAGLFKVAKPEPRVSEANTSENHARMG